MQGDTAMSLTSIGQDANILQHLLHMEKEAEVSGIDEHVGICGSNGRPAICRIRTLQHQLERLVDRGSNLEGLNERMT